MQNRTNKHQTSPSTWIIFECIFKTENQLVGMVSIRVPILIIFFKYKPSSLSLFLRFHIFSILLGQNWLSHISWTTLGMSNWSLPQVGSIWKFFSSFTFEKFKHEQNTLSNTPGHSSHQSKAHEINVVMLEEGMCKCFCCPNTMLRFISQELDSMWVLQWCTYTRIISWGRFTCQWTVCTLINNLILILFSRNMIPINIPEEKKN